MGILHTPTQVHTVICMQTSTHRHTHPETHTPPKTESKLHHKSMVPRKAEMHPSIQGNIYFIGLIQTPTVKLLLSPALSLPPLEKRDGFFFLYSRVQMFKTNTSASQSRLYFLSCTYRSAFYCQFSFS